jgi:hypothetical protein
MILINCKQYIYIYPPNRVFLARAEVHIIHGHLANRSYGQRDKLYFIIFYYLWLFLDYKVSSVQICRYDLGGAIVGGLGRTHSNASRSVGNNPLLPLCFVI